jgi:hypothetical protein
VSNFFLERPVEDSTDVCLISRGASRDMVSSRWSRSDRVSEASW